MNSATEILPQQPRATAPARSSPAWTVRLAILLLLAVALGRIVATYWVFNQTIDEPYHVAAGIEWWQLGQFTMDPVHPPFGRIFIGLGPYLRGARLGNSDNGQIEGNRYFYGPGRYLDNLALARLGVLPFFILAVFVVATWARRLGGNVAAVAAVLLFTTLPPVLAHAGLATTDTPVEGMVALALFVFVLWIDRPTLRCGAALGATAALAALSKISAVPFLLVSAAVIVIASLLLGGPPTRAAASRARPPGPPSGRWQTMRGRSFALAAVVLVAVIWAAYRFTWAPVSGTPPQQHSGLQWALYLAGRHLPLPAPQFWDTFEIIRTANLLGRRAYLLGAARVGGFWYFFPVALLVKTPLPFLVLSLIGAAFLLRDGIAGRDWRPLAPLLAAAAILAVGMAANINIGLRHILPIYPLLSIVAGTGVATLWNAARKADADRPLPPAGAVARVGRAPAAVLVLVAALLGWQLLEGARAHPDYLPYFNQLAGGHGERILIDSDLDWGQDVLRLGAELRKRGIGDDIWFAYFGSANPWLNGLPRSRPLDANRPVTGWIAISEYRLRMGDIPPHTWNGYAWLRAYQPVARVGRSILLYYVPPRAAEPSR